MDLSAPAKTAKCEAVGLRYCAATPPAGECDDHIALLPSHQAMSGYRPDRLPVGSSK